MTQSGKCPICKIVGLLMVLGAINWGLSGVFHLNLVEKLLGGVPHATTVVYGLIGLAGLAGLVCCVKPCPCSCKKP